MEITGPTTETKVRITVEYTLTAAAITLGTMEGTISPAAASGTEDFMGGAASMEEAASTAVVEAMVAVAAGTDRSHRSY